LITEENVEISSLLFCSIQLWLAVVSAIYSFFCPIFIKFLTYFETEKFLDILQNRTENKTEKYKDKNGSSELIYFVEDL